MVEAEPSAVADPDKNPPLALRAARKGILYGAASRVQHLAQDAAHAAVFARECGVLVAENELKWRALRPAPGVFRFQRPDRLLEFAQEHRLAFRGHCLVWHIDNPAWLAEAVRSSDPARLLDEHIWAVAGRYRGLMHSWDVVNEAIRINDRRDDGLRETIWLNALGPGYIERAFRAAAEADPSALLVYNDFDIEFADRAATLKRDAVFRLLDQLKASGAPVHVLGIQAHLDPARPFDPHVMTRLLEKAAGLGLHVFITELDVDDRRLAGTFRRRDKDIADSYRAYLDTVLAHPAVALVTTWGLSDKYTWLNEPEYKRFGWTSRPLPLNAEMHRKPAWRVLAEAFDAAPRRAPLPNRQGVYAPILESTAPTLSKS